MIFACWSPCLRKLLVQETTYARQCMGALHGLALEIIATYADPGPAPHGYLERKCGVPFHIQNHCNNTRNQYTYFLKQHTAPRMSDSTCQQDVSVYLEVKWESHSQGHYITEKPRPPAQMQEECTLNPVILLASLS